MAPQTPRPGHLPTRSQVSCQVLVLFFLSGAAALVYEIAWSRQIGLLFGHTVYAAAITLGAYFAGMAVGYGLAARWAASIRRPLFGYGIAELAVAAWALLTPQLVSMLELPALSSLISPADPLLQLAVRSLVAFCMLMPATVALGATLPLIAEHLHRESGRCGGVALAYGINTLGAVSGVLLATFVLLVHVGVRSSGYLAAAVSALCGVAGMWLGRTPPRRPLLSTGWSARSHVAGMPLPRSPGGQRWHWRCSIPGCSP